MTAAELMKPRFEIIVDYPNNEFGKVGDILGRDWGHYPNGEEFEPKWKISDYPHLFRKMNWWEKRTPEQMPKKLMSILDDKGDTYEIEEWDMEILVGWINKKERTCCSLLTFKAEYGYVPVD